MKKSKYVEVSVNASITIQSDAFPDAVKLNVIKKLNEFLNPSIGFMGEGWPIGRSVYLSEIQEVIQSVEGVNFVTSLDLISEKGCRGINGSTSISHDYKISSGEHRVEIVKTRLARARGEINL